jgi:DNA (cytosine-5)-methyltransferase 1
MIRNQLILDVNRELIIDNFAGGGGASTGIELALGRHVDIAVNHDRAAVALHSANHPQTQHFCEDVFKIDPRKVTGGRPVGLAWFSPDCKHFSKAKGGKPRSKKIRGLAWIVIKWAKANKPRVIILENVEEFEDWGPLLQNRKHPKGCVCGSPCGIPCPDRKGRTFRIFINKLKRLGYQVEWRELRACDYGAPTIRKRLFLIARCDGKPIVWPTPTHADPNVLGFRESGLKPWRTAAECIDWSLPCYSIFLTKVEARAFGVKRPLADSTMRRIARGVYKFVLNNDDPFIVQVAHGESSATGKRWGKGIHSVRQPLRTQPASNTFGLTVPAVIPLTHQGSDRVEDPQQPFRTITSAHRGEKALAQAILQPFTVGAGGPARAGEPRTTKKPFQTMLARNDQHIITPFTVGAGGPAYSGKPGKLNRPFKTMTAENHQQLVAPFIADANRPLNAQASSGGKPLRTQCAEVKGGHFQLVSAFLNKHRFEDAGSKATKPMPTITAGSYIKRPAGAGHALGVTAAQLIGCGGRAGQSRPRDASEPMATITAKADTCLAASHLTKFYGTTTGQPTGEPMHSVTSQGKHIGHVLAFLEKYYSEGGQDQDLRDPLHTVPTKDRFGLITVDVDGEPHIIADIGMRMLTPRELYRGQGFPESYIIEMEIDAVTKKGKKYRKRMPQDDQVRMCGNSVCPPIVNALVSSNVPEMAVWSKGERRKMAA